MRTACYPSDVDFVQITISARANRTLLSPIVRLHVKHHGRERNITLSRQPEKS